MIISLLIYLLFLLAHCQMSGKFDKVELIQCHPEILEFQRIHKAIRVRHCVWQFFSKKRKLKK